MHKQVMLKDVDLKIRFESILVQAYQNLFFMLAKNTPNVSRYQIRYDTTTDSLCVIAVYDDGKMDQVWSSSEKSNKQNLHDDFLILDEFKKINPRNAILKIIKLHHDDIRGFK